MKKFHEYGNVVDFITSRLQVINDMLNDLNSVDGVDIDYHQTMQESEHEFTHGITLQIHVDSAEFSLAVNVAKGHMKVVGTDEEGNKKYTLTKAGAAYTETLLATDPQAREFMDHLRRAHGTSPDDTN